MKRIIRPCRIIAALTGLMLAFSAIANVSTLSDLENYQNNTPSMSSAGLPDESQLKQLKEQGVTHVVDLLPGDRQQESEAVKDLGMAYFNVPVDWENPTVDNFNAYAEYMNTALQSGGHVLTHCRKNWRGAVFTYLYRVTELNTPTDEARMDLDAIWSPNETWQQFMDEVLTSREAGTD